MITTRDKTPVGISDGAVIIQRNDIATTHEKADDVIVQQAIRVAVKEPKYVTVLAVNNDVYFELGLRTPTQK